MLKRILKIVILSFLSLVISASLTSCKKGKDTIAAIVVKDASGKPVSQARVVLHSNPLKQLIYSYNPENYTDRSLDLLVKDNLDTIYSSTGRTSSIFRADWTDERGRAEFTFPLEMILNVSVLKNNGNDEHLGANVINIKKEKTTTKTIRLLTY
jgi:hypothetical protein